MPTIISKSKYLLGLQCPKLLWHAVRKPESIPAPDKSEQARFDQGHEVGRLAQSLWPGGQAIAWEMDFKEKIATTRAAMPKRKPIYEATFAENQVYAQVDILSPAHGGAWNIYEVKSSTSIKKPKHLHDVAFQKYACESAGIRIGQCFLVHINADYVRKGPVNPEGLFNKEEVTRDIKEASSQIKANLQTMQKILARDACPEVKIGPQCSNPYECPLHDLCWGFIPETSVFDLYRGGAKSFALLKRGVFRLRDIPADVALTDKQTIQVKCARTSKPHIQVETIRRFLDTLSYPLQFLDFETFNPTIPLYDGVRPSQQIPFQYSLHVVEREGAKPLHYGWLAEGKQDPRPGLLAHLKHHLREKGSIVAFYMVFEKSRLTEMAKAFPENKVWIHDALERIVDLITPFRQFGYYHPAQHGSMSLKDVLPVLTERGYDQLAISNGGIASQEFLRMAFTDISQKEQQSIRRNLEQYCGLDTENMIHIIKVLERMCA